MTVKEAREKARLWIVEKGSVLPGFCAAYSAGSTNWQPDDGNLPTTSDIDVMAVLDHGNESNTRCKFMYRSVLLEVSYLWKDQFQLSEQVLSDYHLAPSLRTTKIVFDRSGFLGPLLEIVQQDYAKRQWVRQRIANTKNKIMRSLASINHGAPLLDQAMACLFTAGITAHVLLVAGLRNPTVRARYQAVRDLLADYGHTEVYESLLELLGAARISRRQASQHVAALTPVFDTAESALRTPFPFASDVSQTARAIAIDGSLELIERGYHREAMFWVAVTHSRCQKILSVDAPSEQTRTFADSYYGLLEDFGLHTSAAVRQRCAAIERMLPGICNLGDTIVAANDEIEHD